MRDRRVWLWTTVFVAGNLLFPQVCHLFPTGGKAMLPIMLFTLVASVRFGLWCGLATAVLSPLASVLIFGVPAGAILTAVAVKSVVIALAFGLWRQYKGGFSIAALVSLVIGVQLVCFVFEGAALFGFAASWSDLLVSWPGMSLQLIAGMIAGRRQ